MKQRRKHNKFKRLLTASRATAKSMCYVYIATVDNRFQKVEPVNFKSYQITPLNWDASAFLDNIKFTYHAMGFAVWRNKKGVECVSYREIQPIYGTREQATNAAKAAIYQIIEEDFEPDYIVGCGYILLPKETYNKREHYIKTDCNGDYINETAFDAMNIDLDRIINLFDLSGLETDYEKSLSIAG